MEHLSNDHEVHPTLHEIIINCTMKRDIRIELKEGQWKLRQKHGQTLPMEGKPLWNKY